MTYSMLNVRLFPPLVNIRNLFLTICSLMYREKSLPSVQSMQKKKGETITYLTLKSHLHYFLFVCKLSAQEMEHLMNQNERHAGEKLQGNTKITQSERKEE